MNRVVPPHVQKLKLEANSSDPYISGSARNALSAMGRKGGKVAGQKKRARREAAKQIDLELKASAEAYARASRGW